MLIQIQYLHPADMAKPDRFTGVQPHTRVMYLNTNMIFCINKESVQIQSISRFSQEPQLIEVLPPINHYTVILNSNVLPAIFLHDEQVKDILQEYEDDSEGIINFNQ